MAQWNKPVCLLHKPVFQAYMLWRLYTALQKKKVISAAVWIRRWVEKAERIILAWFRTCCSWPGFCKAPKAQAIKGEFFWTVTVDITCACLMALRSVGLSKKTLFTGTLGWVHASINSARLFSIICKLNCQNHLKLFTSSTSPLLNFD